jgi:hypothetical protein
MTSITYGMRKSLCKVRFDMYQGTLANFLNVFGLKRLENFCVTGLSTRNRKIMFMRSRARPVHKADNFIVICEQCGILNIKQPYEPAWPLMGIASPFFFLLTGAIHYVLTAVTMKTSLLGCDTM